MSGAYGRPAEQVDQGPPLVPFRGVRFAADGPDLTALTFVPPPAWSTVDAGAQPAGGLLGLLAPAFGVEDRSRESAAMLARWDADGLLVRDDNPAMYVYRRRGGDSVLTGLVAGVSLQQTSLVPHEEVIDAAVGRQHALAAATHAQLEPIVALVEEHGAAESLRRAVRQAVGGPPDRQLSEHGVTHEIWSVAASATHREVASGVGSAPLLVADGHHRLAAWSRLAQRAVDPGGSPWAYALTMLLDASQDALSLGPVHRVVSDLQPVDLQDALTLDRIGGADEAKTFLQTRPQDGCVVFAGGAWFSARPRAGEYHGDVCAVPGCAVCWLHGSWLPAAGVTEERISYVHSVEDAIARASSQRGTAFLLPPIGLEVVLDAARRGSPLPHKATSFGPKPRVGMIMRHWGGTTGDLTPD